MDINAFEKKGDEPCLEWIRIEMIRLIADQAKEKKKNYQKYIPTHLLLFGFKFTNKSTHDRKGGFFFFFQGGCL